MRFQLLQTASLHRPLSRRGARSQTLPCRELRRAPYIYLGCAVASAGTLFRKQTALALHSPFVTAERAALTDDSMTWDDDRGAIVGDRIGHGAHGVGRADRVCNIGVGPSFAERNLLQLAPDSPLES